MIPALLAALATYALLIYVAALTVGSWWDAIAGGALVVGAIMLAIVIDATVAQLRTWRDRRRYRLPGARVVNLDAGRRQQLRVIRGGKS